MKAVERHVEEKWMLLYIRRWLVVPYQKTDGEIMERTCGVPQGSVIGPILANLYLHYSFDKWMEINHPSIKFDGTRMILYATVEAAKKRSFCLKYYRTDFPFAS